MNELPESAPDLTTELRLLRQAIGDLAVIITGKMDLRGPAVLDMKEAASYLGTTRGSLYDLVGRGGIPFRKVRRKNIFLKKDLDAWLDALPGLSVKQAIASIPLEHRELWIKGSVRIRYEEPAAPEEPIIFKRGPRRTHLLPQTRERGAPADESGLTRGPKGHNRERLLKG